MIQGNDPFARMVTAGFDAWMLSMQAAETMFASQAVISRRMAMLGNGLRGTREMPFAEFSRLIPEKTAAFGKANAGAMRAMVRGFPGALMSDNLAMLAWWEHLLSAACAWWLPVHAKATSNATRLSRVRR